MNNMNDTNINNIESIDNVTLYWYIVIFVMVIYAFSRIEINLNILYGTVIAGIIIYALNYNYTTTKNTINNVLSEKKNNIVPKPLYIDGHNEFYNFLFSIQDFYIYNPQAYEDMINHIDEFFLYYDEVQNNNEIAGYNYDLIDDKRRLILNSLQSIIYKFPKNAEYVKKLEQSISMLNNMLYKYLDKVKQINEEYIFKHGYNTNTKIISNSKVVPFNTFASDINATFDIY